MIRLDPTYPTANYPHQNPGVLHSNAVRLNALYPDILRLIFTQLGGLDLVAMQRTCKAFYTFLANQESLLKKIKHCELLHLLYPYVNKWYEDISKSGPGDLMLSETNRRSLSPRPVLRRFPASPLVASRSMDGTLAGRLPVRAVLHRSSPVHPLLCTKSKNKFTECLVTQILPLLKIENSEDLHTLLHQVSPRKMDAKLTASHLTATCHAYFLRDSFKIKSNSTNKSLFLEYMINLSIYDCHGHIDAFQNVKLILPKGTVWLSEVVQGPTLKMNSWKHFRFFLSNFEGYTPAFLAQYERI